MENLANPQAARGALAASELVRMSRIRNPSKRRSALIETRLSRHRPQAPSDETAVDQVIVLFLGVLRLAATSSSQKDGKHRSRE